MKHKIHFATKEHRLSLSTTKEDKRIAYCNDGIKYIYKPFSEYSYKWGEYKGWVAEHRFNMMMHLKRRLNSNEKVIHIDGDKTNNELSNLHLAGVEQLDDGRKERIAKYFAMKLKKERDLL